MSQTKTVTVTPVNPIVDGQKVACMEAINNLSPTGVKNLKKLLDSPKAMGYLKNDLSFMKLKFFI
tara:strand:- start:19329 stop:19523 length:195 start_codon:yes stop_codon:yes gene_type:complete